MTTRGGGDLGGTIGRVPAYVRGVRQGGLFFIVMGLAGFSAYLIPGNGGYHRTELLAILPAVVVLGALARTRVALWMTGYRSLIFPAVGLATVAVCNGLGLLSPVPLGLYFIVVFLWIGQWHPPGTALRFTPVAVLAYLLPFAIGAPNHDGQAASAVLVLAASVMVAEVVARQTATAHRALDKQAHVLELLGVANRTDDLTGLGNRRLGNQLLEDLAEGDAVIVLDVDRFKSVNDTHGHAQGDRLLQDLGVFLRLKVRDPEYVARMGGEEFMVVIKRTNADVAYVIAERLVRGWRRTGALTTISAGIAMHVPGQRSSVTYGEADAALYRAKGSGRDQVVLSTDPA
jgi:diguanylate cyclase (GGDEF)-like protein